MKIIAIETSCDDTGVSIMEARKPSKSEKGALGALNFKILSNIVSSQTKIHKKWGGVYPMMAKREHQKNLIPALIQSLKEAKLLKAEFKPQNYNIQKLKKILEREENLETELEKFLLKCKKPEIGAIAVTVGPGLEPCLWVGVNFARALSFIWNLPIVPVNHVEAHIFANLLPQIRSKPKINPPTGGQKPKIQIKNKKIEFPAVCLIVSGGHTQLILMKGFGKYEIVGETRDDAAGECFDKTARILGLEYPGGPAIAAEAAKLSRRSEIPSAGNAKIPELKVKLPRPMIHHKNYDFSFSGLKTAVLYDFNNRPREIRESKEYLQKMAAEIQQAIIDVLIAKTLKAAKDYKAKSIILGGGVAANDELRKQFKLKTENRELKINLLIPPKIFCSDNAAMAAITGYYRWLKKEKANWRKIKANANLRIDLLQNNFSQEV